jgi:hypothetical protein
MMRAWNGICLVALVTIAAHAQVLRCVRTDPAANPSVITATKLFGFDVIADSIAGVTAVSFELRYRGAQYVRLAAWKPRALSRQSVYVIDLSDTASGNGSIHIGVLSGQPSSQPGMDSPTVLHLDFVVLPTAPHGALIQFDARSAEAVVGGATPVVVPLQSAPLVLRIHSFVAVYPGDANNDGRVDQRDFSTVALYLGQGAGGGPLRGYRRQPASTLWEPQLALAWDDEQATYADCDGSGDITLADALVVKVNYDSLRTATEPVHGSQGALDQSPPVGPPSITIALTEQRIRTIALELAVPAHLESLAITAAGWTMDFVHYDTSRGRALCIASSAAPRDMPIIPFHIEAGSQKVETATVVAAYVLLADSRTIVPVSPMISSVTHASEPTCPKIYPQLSASYDLIIESGQSTLATIVAPDGRMLAHMPLNVGTNRYPLGSFLPSGAYWLRTNRCTVAFTIAR